LERLLQWGVPLALLFAAILSLCRRLPDNWIIKSLEKAGDASYSIYLFQIFSIPGFDYIFKIIGLDRFVPVDIIIFALAICSIFSGYIAYLLVEKPLTTYFRKKFRAV
jgi:peptidoglycan/LPS O-acetylase OafA/YrhL